MLVIKTVKNIHNAIYSTYNQITKLYNVFILSKQQYDKLSKKDRNEIGYMVLKRKSKITPPDDNQPPKWFSWWVEHDFKPLKQKVDNIEQKVEAINSRLDNLVAKNNLVE